MLKHSKYTRNIWENNVLSKRIISWILNADIILNNGFFEFKKNFLTSIILQTNHLKKNIKFENDYTKKTEILVAILLTGLVFKEYKENYNLAIKELEKLVKVFFDNYSNFDLYAFGCPSWHSFKNNLVHILQYRRTKSFNSVLKLNKSVFFYLHG